MIFNSPKENRKKLTLSILHISDLHRDPRNPIRNEVLLDSLERDRDRYTSTESPRIKPPELVVVSGDVIQGVKHGVSDASTMLRRQYDEAINFLSGLAVRFVDGDRDRVIVVPGNHDVSDHHFRKSLVSVDVTGDAKRELVSELFHPGTRLRWSWSDFRLYEIDDLEMYEQRFAAFADFYEEFYEGKRRYSTDPTKQRDIFDFPDWGLTVVGLCSCYNNDLLNRQGSIHPDCIGHVGTTFRKSTYQDRLRIAVWHHNTEGSPNQVDYMDPDIVQNLIDGGFCVGLHGHHHKPEHLETKFRHGPDRKMILLSAGTLCGGAAFRFGRAYNVVELDVPDRSGQLHVREMQNDNLEMPIWGPRSLQPNSTTLPFSFDPPPEPFVRADVSTSALVQAQDLYDKEEYFEVVNLLLPISESEELSRPLILDCLTRLDDVKGIIDVFHDPKGPAETIALMDAYWAQKDVDQLATLLKAPLVAESTDPSVIEIRTKYEGRLRK